MQSCNNRPTKIRFILDTDDETNEDETTNAPPLTPECCAELWYQPYEIDAFKSETRNLCLYGGTGAKDEFCGLERFTHERLRHKKQVIHYVLYMAVHKQKRGAHFLRYVTENVTAWARDIAVSQGYADFCQAYNSSKSWPGNDCESHKHRLFSTENGKRKLVDAEPSRSCTEDRRIRPCLSRVIPT